jgi:hypothetical protein
MLRSRRRSRTRQDGRVEPLRVAEPDSRGALIVDGPRPGGPGGMYRVRIARTLLATDELDRAVKEFQSARNLVTFAAPTE